MTDSQPALGLNTFQIEWYNDPDDAHPIQPTSNLQKGTVFKNILHFKIAVVLMPLFVMDSGQCTHPVQTTQGTRLAAAIAEDKLDEFGNLGQPGQPPRRRPT